MPVPSPGYHAGMRREPALLVAVAAALVAAGAAVADAASGASPGLRLERLVRSGLGLGDVVVAGDRLLLVAETTGQIRSTALDGSGLRRFARLPRVSEELRCRVAPAGLAGFTPGEVWCHAPDNVIWRIGAGGGAATKVATLPEQGPSDGALAFDTGGRFGGRLLAATGGSGQGGAGGGTVYAVTAHGEVQRVAAYDGPGGADNIAMAPPSFGRDAGLLLLAIDHLPKEGKAASEGRLVALAPDGTQSTLLAAHGVGFNGIVALPHDLPPAAAGAGVGGRAGLLLSETFSKSVWRLPAAALAGHGGAVVVSGETRLWLAAVTRRADGSYASARIAAGPQPAASVNFEGIAWLGAGGASPG